jgi:hypothetical protein
MIQERGIDGNLGTFRMPTLKEYGAVRCSFRYNTAVTRSLGIESQVAAMTRMDEMDQYLAMFAAEFPGGTPIMATGGAMGAYFNNLADSDPFWATFHQPTDQYRYWVFEDSFMDFVNTNRRWREAGFIPSYVDTMTDEDMFNMNLPYSMLGYFNVGKPGGGAELSLQSYPRYGHGWDEVWFTPPVFDIGAIAANSFALNANSTNAAAAVFIYQVICTDYELNALMNVGIEGRHYNMVNGVLERIDPDVNHYWPGLMWMIGNRMILPRLPNEPENLAQVYMDFNNAALRFNNEGFPIWDTEWDPVISEIYWGMTGAIWAEYGRSMLVGTITDADIAAIHGILEEANYRHMLDTLNAHYRTWRDAR